MKTLTLLLTALSALGANARVVRAEPVMTSMVNQTGEKVGEAQLTQTPAGVLIQLRLTKAAPGTHAFHIHEVGKCEPPFTSAGGHFNPLTKKHGMMSQEGWHIGDLPNLHIPENGTLTVEVFVPQAKLSEGTAPLLDGDGASLVLHADADDYKSDPAGNAGQRIACGVIGGPSGQAAK
jgi:superoxide dismutase, Cu-Zn family